MSGRPLQSASIDQLEGDFEAAKDDYARLKLIADELQHRSTPRAGRLRFKIGAAMVQAKRARDGAAQSSQPPSPPQHRPLAALLAEFGLTAPDARPLHRYRLGGDDYGKLEALLRSHAARLGSDTSDAALLALWASAWFRRHYSGGVRKYSDLGAAIGANIPDSQWRELLERGLNYWRRPLIERMRRRHRLLTIAVEGGFPVRVLATSGGWLSRYLNEVVGRLLGLGNELSSDDAFAMADAAKEKLRDTYRQDAFIALAADLALSIVKLRRVAETAAPGLTPSAVLDQVRPGWRDELPIATDTEAARTLVDGMLAAEKIARGLSGGAGCVRILRRRADGWCAGLRLSLGGEFKAQALEGLAAPGTRLGVHPHGVLARAMGEELAFLDPPGEGGDSWRLRPLTRKTELNHVPLDVRIDVRIQSPSGAARVVPWPGGEPERSDVITFEIDVEDEEGPRVLVLAARGSASLRAERVVVTAPADWSLRWENGTNQGAPKRIGITGDGLGLWLIERSVLVESTDGGLLYFIKPGADEEVRDRIALEGPSPQQFEGADNVPLFAGSPTVRCFQGRTIATPKDNELLWRRSRGDPWHDLASSRLPAGVIDIMWRDARTGFVRDRVRTAIVSQAAQVTRDRDGSGWCYCFKGFGDFKIEPEPCEGLHFEQRPGGVFTLFFRKNPRRRVNFVLRAPGSMRAIRIALSFPLHDGIADWDGRIVPPGSEMTPTELGELVAFGDGRLKLFCELEDTEIDIPAHYTIGEQELGLRPLAERIRSDLAWTGIDARAALSFVGATDKPWRVKPFDSEIRCTNGAVSILSMHGLGEGPLAVMGRPIAAPCDERCLAEIGLEDALNRRSITLPGGMAGVWWIYLRTGRVVRSRPLIVPFAGEMAPADGGLAATAAIASPSDRQAAITERLHALSSGAEGTVEDLAWLARLIASLDGIPASTFDALAALPDAPIVLARLLLFADDTAQVGIWRLEAELPFLWASLPLKAWNAAAELLGRSVMEPLLSAGWELARAAAVGKQIVDSAAARAGNLDPAIAAVLAAANLLPKPLIVPSILDAAQGYVRRTFDRGDMAIGLPKQTSLFRTPDIAPLLPTWLGTRFDLTHLEALDAPIAVAAAAKTGTKLSLAQLRRCKEAAVVDSVYFAEGIFAALFGEDQ